MPSGQQAVPTPQEAIQLALDHCQAGRFPEAECILQEILAIEPGNLHALRFLGLIAHQAGKYELALEFIARALSFWPDNAEALFNGGNILQELGRTDEALACYDKVVAARPDFAQVFINRSITLQELKRFEEALASCDQALAIDPGLAEALGNRGNILQDLKRFEEALVCYDKALAMRADFAEALLFNRANALNKLGRHDEALADCNQALATRPDFAQALCNRGDALKGLQRYEDAVSSYDEAIAINPAYMEALSNRSDALQELGRFEEALASCDKALAVDPDYAEALCNRGNILLGFNRLEDALACCDRVLTLNPGFAEALNNRGNALHKLRRFEEALASYEKSLAIEPGDPIPRANRAVTLQELKRYGEALAAYDEALSIDPAFDYLPGSRLHVAMHNCDWTDFERQVGEIVRRIELGEKVAQPFPVLALTSSPRVQRMAAQILVNDRFRPKRLLPALPRQAARGRLRIGYYSTDFRNHAVAHLIAGLFEQHDRDKFEVFGFYFGPDTIDDMRKRIAAAFDKFVDVRGTSDTGIALLSRNLGIDIAVDLNGFTADNRAGIFSHRAAPLQVSFLGYPGTTAAEYIDYLVADETLIPENCRQYYSEKIAYLPDSYQANDRKRAISPANPTRSDLGLPSAGFVYCCFNSCHKITPVIFDRWMRILARVKGSVLWLLQGNSVAARNLRREAAARGVDPARLIFADQSSLPEHLARHRAADLFIDTLPYNAHTTASDALWAGLPVLTCMEEAFASRVAASLLNAVRLPELVTTTLDQYEALAIELATNHERLAQIRHKLAANRLTAPLFDTRLFARHLEDAYAQMHERHHAKFPPEHLHVKRR